MTLVENLLSVMEPSTFYGLVNLINLNLQHSSEVVKNPSHSRRNRITAIWRLVPLRGNKRTQSSISFDADAWWRNSGVTVEQPGP